MEAKIGYSVSNSPYYFREKHLGEERRIFILFDIVAYNYGRFLSFRTG